MTARPHPRTPVIVGVGQILQRTDDPSIAADATLLICEAVRAAAVDSAAASDPIAAADLLAVVSTLTWRYGDAARVVTDRLGIHPRRVMTPMGGNSPQSLVNAASSRILSGDLDMAILTGGEAWRSRMRARRDGIELTWPKADPELLAVEPPEVWGHDLEMSSEAETEIGLIMPIQVYPMFESAIRAARAVDGVGPEEHLRQVGAMWARFSEVASRNPFAWRQDALTASDIISPGPGNRMVGLPYTKAMNSNNDVDMAAAVIICSVERAEALGIPADRWVFPHAGTDCHEHPFISHRDVFHRTPAIAIGGAMALELADTDIDAVAHLDLYSCFPSAVQLGATSLGIDPYNETRSLTQTGGLSFAGGPWNEYVMHAIATMVHTLRNDAGSTGLVWANGGFVTKHAFGVYSTTPPATDFRHAEPQARIDALPSTVLATADDAANDTHCTIEAYTVMHGRDGSPEAAWSAIRLADGRRAWGRTDEAETLSHLVHGEHVGEQVRMLPDHRFEPL
ncbi:MAG: acetyl-CoA acetyltransferase [Ilumatobacteraceae bacterium]